MTLSQFLTLYYLLWCANLCLTIGLFLFEVKRRNVAFTFWLAMLFVFVLPSALDPFLDRAQADVGLPTLDLVNNPLLLKAHVFALLFGAIYLLCRLAAFRAESRLNPAFEGNWIRITETDPEARGFSLAATLACLAGLVAALLALALGGGFSTNTLGYADFIAGGALWPRLLAYYLILSFGAAVAVAWWCRRWACAGLIITSALLLLAISNSRQVVVPLAMTFLAYFAFRDGTVKRLLALLLLATFAYGGLYVLQSLRFGRDTSAMIKVIESGDLIPVIEQFAHRHGSTGEADLRLCDYYFFQDSVRQRLAIDGDTYVRLLLLPLPSVAAGSLKPPDVDARFYNEYYGGRRALGGTLPILMYGNAYENAGWLGLAFAILWAAAAYVGKWLAARARWPVRLVLVGFFSTGWIHLARGAIYDTCALVFWGSIAISLVWAAVHAWRRQPQGPWATVWSGLPAPEAKWPR